MPADPFEALRESVVPLAPRPEFVTRLRDDLRSRLTPAPTAPSAEPRITTMSVVPYLSVHDAEAAIAFYTEAFGAIETLRYTGDDGRIGHAELTIGGAPINLADEYPEMGVRGPQTIGGTSVSLVLHITDVEYTFGRAVANGATAEREPADQSYELRTATVIDPFGHRWMLHQDLDPATRSTGDPASANDQAPADAPMPGFTITHRRPVEPGYLVLRTDDLARARAFFGELFAWEVEAGSLGDGFGHVANTTFPMGFAPPDDQGPSLVYFRVDDIEPYAAKVASLGGQVLSRQEHPSGGNAECVDDQGFRFDLFQPAAGY